MRYQLKSVRTRRRPLSTLLLLIGVLLLGMEAPSTLASEGELFTSDQALQVEIQAPWRKLIRKKDNTRWPAKLLLTDAGGGVQTIELTVERRGISRQRVCKFPPIRLRFEKDSAKGTIFESVGALKMVTHCAAGTRWTQYYVLEMLAYRIYNLITDASFRVRPLRIQYFDTDKEKQADENFAFLIEDIDKLADRFNMKELQLQSTVPSRQDAEIASRMALFQYMIGNLDWSTIEGSDDCCHNAKFIGPKTDEPPFIPVPYDFDSSGFVDPHYAVAPKNLGVRSVTDRYFRGYCRHNRTLPAARQTILEHENDIMALVRDEPRLNQRTREKALDFLQEFFDLIGDTDEWIDKIVSRCRN